MAAPKEVQIGIKIKVDGNELIGTASLSQKELQKLQKQGKATSQSFGNMSKAAKAFYGVLAFGTISKITQEILKMTDANKRMLGQLSLVTSSFDEARIVQEKLFKVAQDTRSQLEPTVALYARIARNTKDLGLAQEELLQITTTVNQSLQVAGATSRESAAGVIQLSQALASGRLAGDEFRSVAENMPRLARAIADGLGLPLGKLRELSRAGLLTTEIVVAALSTQAEKIEEEYGKIPKRLDQSVGQLKNAFVFAFRDIDTSQLSESIDTITEQISSPEFQANVQAFSDSIAGVVRYLTENSDEIIRVVSAFAGLYTAGKLPLPPQLKAIAALGGAAAGYFAPDFLGGDEVDNTTNQIKVLESKIKDLKAALDGATFSEQVDGVKRYSAQIDQASESLDNLNGRLAALNRIESIKDKIGALENQIVAEQGRDDFGVGDGGQESIKRMRDQVFKLTFALNDAQKAYQDLIDTTNKPLGGSTRVNSTIDPKLLLAQQGLKVDQEKGAKQLDALIEDQLKQLTALRQGDPRNPEILLRFRLSQGDLKGVVDALDSSINPATYARQLTESLGSSKAQQLISNASEIVTLRDRIKATGELKSLTESLETPQEKYNRQLAELDKLSQRVAISETTMARAQASYAEELEKSNPLIEEARRLTESLLTPTEQFAKEVEHLNKLVQEGGLSQETYGRAIEKAKDDLKNGIGDLDEQSELARQAASNIQDAFADFLFDPFSEGLEGMVRGFVSAIHQVASQKVASNVIEGLFGEGFADGKADLGGIFGDIAGSLGYNPNQAVNDAVSASGAKILGFPGGEEISTGEQAIVDTVAQSAQQSTAKLASETIAGAVQQTVNTQTQTITVQAAIGGQTTALTAAIQASATQIVAAIASSGASSASSSALGAANVTGGTSSTYGAAFSAVLSSFHTGGISNKEQLAVLLKNEEVLTRDDPRHKMNQGGQKESSSGTRIINVIDPNMVKDYMSSSSGERVVMNILQRNAGMVRQVVA